MNKNPLEDSHLLDLIFGYLDHEDLKRASEVSRLWRDTLDSGKFWKWAALNVNPILYPEQKEMLIHSSKLAIISHIDISVQDKPYVESLLQAITDGAAPKLTELTIFLPKNDAGDIDADILSRTVVKMQYCDIQHAHHSQLEAVLTAIIQSQDLALELLFFSDCWSGIGNVSPGILAAAAMKLNHLEIVDGIDISQIEWADVAPYREKLTQDQVIEVLTKLATTEDSKLRILSITPPLGLGFDISHLSPEIVTRALIKLDDLDMLVLGRFKFSPEQMYHLFCKIGDSELELTRFDVGLWNEHNLYSQVPPLLMGLAISRVESVTLDAFDDGFGTYISTEQIHAIISTLASQELGGSKMKSLEISDMRDELSFISPEILVDAMMRLEEFILNYPVLTADQINAILAAVTEGRDGMLKTIKIKMLYQHILGTMSQTLLETAKKVKHLEVELVFESDYSYSDSE